MTATMMVVDFRLQGHQPQLPWASNATLTGLILAVASSPEENLSMCQNNGSFIPSGSGLFSTKLQPIFPRRSGEFLSQEGSSCPQTADAARVKTMLEIKNRS
jgi:hypothetical protein